MRTQTEATLTQEPGPGEPRAGIALPRRRASDLPARVPGLLGLYLAFWHHTAGRRGRVVLSSLMLIGAELIRLAIPWLAARAINAVQQGGPGALRGAGLSVLAILGASVVSWALHAPGRILERGVALHVRRRLADGLYAKLGRLPLAWHERHHTGETLQRLHKTSVALSEFAQNRFIYLQNVVRLVGPIAALVAIEPVVGAVAAAGFAVVGVVVMGFDRLLVRLANQENEADRRYNAALIEFIGNIQSVLALRLQRTTRALLGERIEQVMRPLGRSILLNEGKWCAVDLLSLALTWSLVAIYALGAREVGPAGQAVLLGSVFMVHQYAQQAAGVAGSLAANLQQFVRYRADYASADPIVQAPDAPRRGRRLHPGWRAVALRDVSFTHAGAPDARRAGLHLAHWTFRRGEKLALVGPSGAGKSTLMRVLAGLYPVERGGCAVEGDADAQLADLAHSATFVPQDTEVFEATLRDNLTLGAERDPADLERALHVSLLDAVQAALPRGLDTPVVERGSNLSGGQKQRVSLARGLLAATGSDLIMLDEPTSALDAVTEAQVFERLRERLAHVTVIASVHRMSVLRHFDRVVLMRAGRIEDVGTIDELTGRSELFRQLQSGTRPDPASGDGGADPTDGIARRIEARDGDLAAALAQAAADADTAHRPMF